MTFNTEAKMFSKVELKTFHSHMTLLEVAYLGGFPWNFILSYNKEYLHYRFGLVVSLIRMSVQIPRVKILVSI